MALTHSVGAAARTALSRVGLLEPLKRAFHRLVVPVPGTQPPGPLNEEVAKTLLAAAEALTGAAIDRDHYERFFRWRAEHLPGHRALYERFTAIVHQAAKRSRGCAFAKCENAARLEILQPAFRVRAAEGRISRLRAGVLQREWVLFDIYIVREIVLLFARTDAWRLAGYESWPATPRGLERYRILQPRV